MSAFTDINSCRDTLDIEVYRLVELSPQDKSLLKVIFTDENTLTRGVELAGELDVSKG